MTEAMLLGVAKSVLGQLGSPALNEILLIWNCKEDIKRLGETIETITCVIQDAEQRQSGDRAVKLWLSRLREVLYDADDLFDTIAAKALHKKSIRGSAFKKEVTLFFSKSNQLGLVIKIAHNIKDVRERLAEIKDDMSLHQFLSHRVEEKRSHRVLERKERHSFVDHKEVIGRDQEKEDIVSLLLSEDCGQHNLEVISVIGFGGLGKTTLAQLVFNDERVKQSFDMCLWTCINYFSELEPVLVKILTSVLKSKPKDLGLDQLQTKLREEIQGKKYLLVLDDVWDENISNWSNLKTLLSCGNIGSKVLITARKIRVAQCLDALKPFYMLGILSEESAWSLFVKLVFDDKEFVGDSELESLGKHIVQRCRYVPLLVSLIGRLLSQRSKVKEVWLSFLEKELAEVVTGGNDDENVMQVLMVSYNDLPVALQYCFAYCSVFPKDHVFDKDELVRMWIAQGFVESRARKSMEEVGDDYFFYLVDTCFFQEVEEYKWEFGVVKYSFKIHDLLHDLAIQVAGGESACFEDDDLRKDDERSTVLRHIFLTRSANSNLSSISNSLRTFIFIEPRRMKIDSCVLVLDRFRTLRTLVLSNLNLTALPDSFRGLIHLRYLDLSRNSSMTALPNSICKLYHLQTLLLIMCTRLKKLPSNLAKLVSLRHIFLDGCEKLDSMPSGLATLTTLVTLDWFVVNPDCGGLRYLGCLDNLCGMLLLRLPTKGWNDCVEDARKAKLSSKSTLSGLSIRWDDREEEEKGNTEITQAVLEELEPHPGIQYIQIENCISDKLPSWFPSLSKIKSLRLCGCSFEYLGVSSLPHLEVLTLDRMDCLRGWWRNAPTATVLTFPRVSRLEIGHCSLLVENMPLFDALEHLTLRSVDVRLVNMLLSNPNGLAKLQVLKLSWIECLESLPEGLLKHLTALKDLQISFNYSLTLISRRGLAYLTSLEKLSIEDCQVARFEDEDGEQNLGTEINTKNMYYGLQRLRKLEVDWQRDLVQEGIRFLTSLQDLEMTYYEEHQVEADNANSECCSSGLKKLQRVILYFGRMRCCFPKWTLHLPCLQELYLWKCGEMNVDEWVAQQTHSNTLLHLTIHSSEGFGLLWVNGIPWHLLPSLRTLILYGELKTIPDGIQQLTSLQSLYVSASRNIKEIPKWIINLTSLQNLHMYNCSTEFEARCDPENGTDWHLISHIPTVMINMRLLRND